MRTIIVLMIILATVSGCKLESFTFLPPSTAGDPLFAGLEQQAKNRKMMSESSYLTSGIDVYCVRYREQQVEETNVLVQRMVSENDPRFNINTSNISSGQNLFIVRLYASNPIDDLFIYYSVSVNINQKVTAVSNAYLGKLGGINNKPYIMFYERLQFKQRKEVNSLEVDRLSGRRKSPDHLLRFQLSDKPERMADLINTEQITVSEINKIGGMDPMLFNVNKVLGSNAMRMKRIN